AFRLRPAGPQIAELSAFNKEFRCNLSRPAAAGLRMPEARDNFVSRLHSHAAAAFIRLKLRARLTLAFLCLSALIGVCGASGLLFIRDIGAKLSIFSDITSPLLGQTVGLVNNARQMRMVYLDAVSNNRPAEVSRGAVADLDAAAARSIARLRELFAASKLPMDLQQVETLQQHFVQQLYSMLAANTKVSLAELKVADKLNEFEKLKDSYDALVRNATSSSEAKMGEIRDTAGLSLTNGSATVDELGKLITTTMNDTYPLIQSLHWLVRDIVTFREIGAATPNIANEQELEKLRRRAELIFANSLDVVGLLEVQASADDLKVDLQKFKSSLQQMQIALLGDSGLLAAQDEVLAAKASLDRLQDNLSATEGDYLRLLEHARELVETSNDEARARSAEVVKRAVGLIGAIVAVGLLFGILFSLFFAKRIVGPIQRLTAAMTKLAGGELDVIVPARARHDEIGDMAA